MVVIFLEYIFVAFADVISTYSASVKTWRNSNSRVHLFKITLALTSFYVCYQEVVLLKLLLMFFQNLLTPWKEAVTPNHYLYRMNFNSHVPVFSLQVSYCLNILLIFKPRLPCQYAVIPGHFSHGIPAWRQVCSLDVNFIFIFWLPRKVAHLQIWSMIYRSTS